MPAALAGAAITAGASIYSSSQAKKASNKATAVQDAAAQQQLALQRETLDKIMGLNEPATAALSPAIAALMRDLGVTPSGDTVARSAPAPQLSYDATGNIVSAPASKNAATGAAKATGGRAGTIPPEGYETAARIAESAQGAATTPAPLPGGPGVSRGGFGGLVDTANSAALQQGAPGGLDYARIAQTRPDLKAEYDRLAATADRNSPWFAQHGLDRGFQGFVDWWAQNPGAAEAGSLARLPSTPTAPPTAPNAPTASQTTQTADPNAPPNLMTAGRPRAQAMTDAGARRDIDMGGYGAAPDLGSYFDPDAFRTDPGYDFRMKEALKGVNAFAGAAGRLRSGYAAKALSDRAMGVADQTYNNWFGQQLQKYQAARGAYENDRTFQGNLWNQQQTRADSNYNDDRAYDTSLWQFGVERGDANFETDRGYQTNRGDNATNNLFRLAQLGLQGAGNVAGAATHYADAGSTIYGNQADAQAQNAYNRAQANSYLGGSLAGLGGNLFAAWGGGSRTAKPSDPFGSSTGRTTI